MVKISLEYWKTKYEYERDSYREGRDLLEQEMNKRNEWLIEINSRLITLEKE